MTRTRQAALAALAIGFAWSAAASATETITYTYDARGRLIRVVQVTPTKTIQTDYTLDKADNRTNVTTTGA